MPTPPLEIRRATQDLLDNVARIALAGGGLRAALQQITDAVAETFGWEFVACVTVDEGQGRFTCQAFTSSVETDVHVGYGRPLGSGVVGTVALTGRSVHLRSLDELGNQDFVQTFAGSQSELCVPVLQAGRVLAVLNAESAQRDAFVGMTPVLEQIAARIAGLLALTEALEASRRQAADLLLLTEVSRVAMAPGGLRPMLARVVSLLLDRFPFPLAAVALIDARAGEFEVAAIEGRGLDLEVVPGTRIPLGRGISARAVRTRQTQVVHDVRHDPDYLPDAHEVVAQLSVPLLWGEQVLGVLTVETVDPAILDARVVSRVQTVAEQIAGSVENARLHDQLGSLFRRHVSPDLAEILMAEPDRFLGRGERREASVLLADVRGFTRLTQKLGGEQVLSLLNQFFGHASEAVVAQRGSVNRYLGDGLLAVFGVPEPLEAHPDAALAAALEIQRRVDELGPTWEAIAGEPLRVTIVLNAGSLIAGSLGGTQHADFTVLGDVVNVAARLEEEAKQRGVAILMTGPMYAMLAAPPPTRRHGDVALRGREGRVELVEVLLPRSPGR